MSNAIGEGRRVLVVAPFGSDAETLRELLSIKGYEAVVCADVDRVAEGIDDSAGAVLLTEEALSHDLGKLRDAMHAQPTWSALPFVMLTTTHFRRRHRIDSPRRLLAEIAGNLLVLERPLGSTTLITAVESALRTRQRQFELRGHLRQLAESRQALSESEAELRLIADSLPVLIGFVDRDYRYRFANAAYLEWFGLTPSQVVGKTVREVVGDKGFEDRREAMARALAGEESRLEISIPRLDGHRRDAEVRLLPRFDHQRSVIGFYVFVIDVTDRIRSQQALRDAADKLELAVAERTRELTTEMANREQAEAALRQSQKMEAVGQLTGGIAHDFNNMLTGIIGSLDIVKRRIAAGRLDSIDRFMDAAFTSAQRAASLTQRLLAFSRRQSLDARPLDVNALISSLEELLLRTLNERVSLRFVLAAGLPAVMADENQLETAVLNLVINSRDAMPQGGHVTIETACIHTDALASDAAELAVGEYVVVSVSDDGVGMEPHVIERAFDPFFTTKPIGQGTGLGLSMLYGFAKQSGGQVRISSRVGEGTTVRLYLPSADRRLIAASNEDHEAPARGRGQSVLVVEDDESVLLLIREVLAELGYRPIECLNPLDAIPMLASERRIDLLVSDVGLPGMNGRELAEVARRYRPDLPILLITGYAENAAIRESFLGTNLSMIKKPFDLKALAARVDRILRGADSETVHTAASADPQRLE